MGVNMKTSLEDGIRYFNLKRYDVAVSYFLELTDPSVDEEVRYEAAYYTGLCYTKLDKFDDALLYLETVVTAGATELRSAQCRLILAYIYMTTKREKMAMFELERLVKNGIESTQMYSMLGYAAWVQNDNTTAVSYYEKAIELDGLNATAVNGLGYILVDSGMDVKRGLELCRKAVQMKPQSAVYLDSVGWAYYKLGDAAEAKSTLRRALEISPRQREITGHMRAVLGEAS
jgi:tetratricopeptide (TPR) repeat protein